MCMRLNLNETGPVKVSTVRAGTLSSAANGVLMIQRSHMLTGAHSRIPLTHTHSKLPIQAHEKYSALSNNSTKQTD